MSALSDLLNANVHGWKARQTAAEAERRGIPLKLGTIAAYFSGRHGTPSDKTLAALSAVLGIPLKDLRTAAGVPAVVDPYELRHTCASLAIRAGANVKVVQRMLGHSSAALTLDRYGHLFDDDLDAVADALGALRSGECGQNVGTGTA